MEQDDAKEHVADRGLVNGRAADEQSRDAEHADLRMRGVGGDVAHVLQVDYHAEAGEHGGHDDGDYSRALDLDAGVTRDLHVLTDCAHILTELGLPEPDDEQAEQRNDDKGERGDLDAADVHGKQVIHALAHVQEADGVSDAVAAGQLEREVLDGDDGAHHVQHDKLIHAVYEEADDIAGYHFSALGHVEELSAEHAEENRERHGEDHRQYNAGDAPHLPVSHEDQRDLTGHCAEGHTEVQTHTGHYREEQAEDEEDVSAHTGDDLVYKVAYGEAGDRDADDADEHEHERHGVVLHKAQNSLTERDGLFAYVFIFHFEPSVFLVRA